MPAAGLKLCGLVGKAFSSEEISSVLRAASRALVLTTQPTPLIYLTFTPRPSYCQHLSPEEHLHFSYPKLGIDFILQPKWDYKLNGDGDLSPKEEGYDLRMLEVYELTVFNGRDGSDTDVTLGGVTPDQVISFSPFPCDIRELFDFDDLMGQTLFFSIKSDTRYEKFERKLGDPDTDYLETERRQKEEEIYVLTWSERSPGIEVVFEREVGESKNNATEVGEQDRWTKYTLINS